MNECKNSIPLNVSSPLRACKNVNSTPLWIERADGECLYDYNQKSYIDFMYAFGPLILGHNNTAVAKALTEQVKKGLVFGTGNYLEQRLANLIVASTPSIEKVRFLNSGTEAVASAIRIARSVTKRTKVLTFSGNYHGHSDLFIQGAPLKSGIDPAIREAKVECQYNCTKNLESLLSSNDFACVILEPIACNMSLVLPNQDFLKTLRQLCDKTGTILIFDEVISGFRYCFGSVSNILGVSADIYCFGKIIGGGTPIGAIAGSKKCFEPLEKREVLQGGTFSGNPLSMSAGVATLEQLEDGSAYEKIENIGAYLEHEFKKSTLVNRIKLVRYYSTFAFQFLPKPAINYEEASSNGHLEYTHIYKACRENGIHLPPDFLEPLHVSLATKHTSIDKLIITIEAALNDFERRNSNSNEKQRLEINAVSTSR